MFKRKKKIAIIDFGLGNISSVQAACEYVGADTIVLNKQDKHIECQISGVILPGVGAFSKAIQSIQETGLSDTIQEAILEKKPIMAICLGHQLLFEKSFEFGISNGLGILKGDVISIDTIPAKQFKPRVPNVGWFELNLNPSRQDVEWDSPPFSDLNPSSHFYFTHSLVAFPDISSIIQSTSTLGGAEFVSSVGLGPVFGCQFHPEKSGEAGLSIYKNFITSC